MGSLKLAEIDGRTWNIQACSALTKEGKLFQFFVLLIIDQVFKKEWSGLLKPYPKQKSENVYDLKSNEINYQIDKTSLEYNLIILDLCI